MSDTCAGANNTPELLEVLKYHTFLSKFCDVASLNRKSCYSNTSSSSGVSCSCGASVSLVKLFPGGDSESVKSYGLECDLYSITCIIIIKTSVKQFFFCLVLNRDSLPPLPIRKTKRMPSLVSHLARILSRSHWFLYL